MRLSKLGKAAIIVGWIVVCCAAGASGQGLEGTGHDFRSAAWSGGKMCTPCHSVQAGWNHALSTQVYALSGTLDAPDYGQPTGVSARCLGCHDGTVALDSFGGRVGATYIPPGAQIGPDLSTHHPVSFTYDRVLTAIDGGLNDPETAPSGLGGTISQDMLEFGGKLECTTCHGLHSGSGNPDLLVIPATGGALCLTCHNAGDHTELRGGFAEHKPGLGNPIDNGCTQCHGPNLDDGFAPSCFTCHGQIWAGGGPPADHTELRGGFAEHKPGLGDPIDNGCTQCHGPNLDDGFAVSCFTCHGALWESENLPPVVATGGPYSGVVGQFIEFDASGTSDPDGDPLTYAWDFGDGSPPSSPRASPTATHAYEAPGTYTAAVIVADGINGAVSVEVVVEVTEGPGPPQGDTWLVDIPFLLAQFTVTFEDFSGILLVETTLPDGSTGVGLGMEYEGMVFWMDRWGALFFGTIDRGTGTMRGVVFGYEGDSSSVWFAEQL